MSGADLTDRERQAMDLVCRGLTNPQIANRLWPLSVNGVKSRLQTAYRKLDAGDRVTAALAYTRWCQDSSRAQSSDHTCP